MKLVGIFLQFVFVNIPKKTEIFTDHSLSFVEEQFMNSGILKTARY